MKILLAKRENLLSGALFTLGGVLTCYLASEHRFGTPSRMGPGFMPLVLGAILAAIGLLILAGSCLGSGSSQAEDEADETLEWRTLLIVTGAIAAFAAALPYLGLLFAVPILVIGSSFASETFRWRDTILLATILTVVSYAIFILGLAVDIPAKPW